LIVDFHFSIACPSLDFQSKVASRNRRKYWPGIFFSVSASLERDPVQIELDYRLQSVSASIDAVCQKTLHEVERDSGAKFLPKNFGKKL